MAKRELDSEDRYALYLVVNTSLNMGVGKISAQCGHAVEMFMDDFYRTQEHEEFCARGRTFIRDVDAWRANSNRRKIALAASNYEFENLKKILTDEKIIHYIVRDAGHTEVAPGSETVICVAPIVMAERPKLLKRLRLL